MRRLIYKGIFAGKKEVIFKESDFNYIIRVLRSKEDDSFELLDDQGSLYEGVIVKIILETEEVIFNLRKDLSSRESNLEEDHQREGGFKKIHLVQGYPKGDKLDFIIEKSIEVGVDSLIPINMERSIGKITKEKKEKKNQRFLRIRDKAVIQCKRNNIPEIKEAMNLKEFLQYFADLKMMDNQIELVVFYEGEKNLTLKKYLDKLGDNVKEREIYIIVGPEGGISPKEMELITNIGGISLTLGENILRCETAPIVAISFLKMYYLQ